MESREVGQDRQCWLAFLCFRDNAIHGLQQRRQVLQNLRDADHRYLFIVCDYFYARGLHVRPAHAEKLHIQPGVQRSRELCGVHVSGRFTGGEE